MSTYSFTPQQADWPVPSSSSYSLNNSALSVTSTSASISATSTSRRHHHKPPRNRSQSSLNSRVKVAVRVRPAFQDEIDFAKGSFLSIVDTKAEDPAQNDPGKVSLVLMSGKRRDFYFDYVFDEGSTQDQVYDRLARPVVTDVLKGYNGTIFAYGQTGTGKVKCLFSRTHSNFFK